MHAQAAGAPVDRQSPHVPANAPDDGEGIAISDLEGNLQFTSTTFAAMHGYTVDELHGRHVSALHTDAQMHAVKDAHDLAEKLGEFRGRLWCTRADGSAFPVQTRISVVHSGTGSAMVLRRTHIKILDDERTDKETPPESEGLSMLDGEALQLKGEQLMDIENSLPAGAVYRLIHAPDGLRYFEHVSAGFERIFSLTEEMVAEDATPLYAMIHPDDIGEGLQAERDAAKSMTSFRYECRIVLPDGETRWVRWHSMPHRLPHGRLAWNGVVIDVTERMRTEEALQKAHNELETRVEERTVELSTANQHLKREIAERTQAEEALRESEERFRQLSDATWEAIVIHSEGIVLEANEQYFEMFGYEPEELIGQQGISKTATPESNEFIRQQIADGNLGPYQATGKRKDGSEFPMEVRIRKMDYHGRQVRVAAIRDLTAQKKAEAALRESEERFRAIADYTCDWESWMDPDAVLLWVNPGVERVTGYTPQECLGMPGFPLPIIHEDEREKWAGELAKAFTERTSGNDVPFRIRRKDGAITWGAVSWQPIYDTDGVWLGYRSSVRDVTERQRVAEELELAKEAAEAASRAKSVLLANLSHEVRTPIMAILGAEELARTKSSNTQPGIQPADIIQRNGLLLLSMFDDLLDAARVEAGQLKVHHVDHSLADIFTNICMLAEVSHENREVELRFSLDGPVPVTIRTDPIRLQQAAVNLISNALRYTDKGHVHVHVKVDRHGEEPRLSMAVEDTGPGIPRKELDRIFEVFERIDSLEGRDRTGAGLGLPLARWVAGELGGTLEVQSKVGRGSTFTLRVATGPLDDVDWVAPDEAWDYTRQTPSGGDEYSRPRLKGSVLLAEDSRELRELISSALRSSGADVVSVCDGRAAVRAALQRDFDLILMDIRMPVMNGEEAVAQLRRKGCLSPIVALTASVAEGKHKRLVEAGFDDLWAKPLPLGELVERVACYLTYAEVGEHGPQPASSGSASDRAHDSRYESIAAEFVQGLPSLKSSLQRAVESGDTEMVREILHRLAGAAGMVGFPRLSEEALRTLSRIREGTFVLSEDELQPVSDMIFEIVERSSRGP